MLTCKQCLCCCTACCEAAGGYRNVSNNDPTGTFAIRRWYRDPSLPLPRTEVTRFPHGVLEVKLSLPEGQKAPEWVQDLLDSGYLTEVVFSSA